MVVLALRWEDVDLAADPPTVSISGTVVRLPGRKAVGGGLRRQEMTKTADGSWRVAAPAFVVEVLLRRRVEAAASAWGFVFSTSAGTPLDPHNVRTKLRSARGEEFAWVTRKSSARRSPRWSSARPASGTRRYSSGTPTPGSPNGTMSKASTTPQTSTRSSTHSPRSRRTKETSGPRGRLDQTES